MKKKSILIKNILSALTVAGVAFSVLAIAGIWIFLSNNPSESIGSSVQAQQLATSSTRLENRPSPVVVAKAVVKNNIAKQLVPEIENESELENSEDMRSEGPSATEKLARALEGLSKLIEEDGKPLLHPIDGADNDGGYKILRAQMRIAISNDPSLVASLIDMFMENPDSLLSREISAVLAETGLPEVQSAALDMGLNPGQYSNEDRAAALFLIAEMDTIEGATRDRLLESYGYEQDSEILQFSLIALKPATSSIEDYARVNETLSSLVVSDDEHVRRHSVYQMAEWATTNDDLTNVRSLALNDPDVNTRARAIMSIAISPIKSSENKALLIGVVNGIEESEFVRKAALDGLNTYPLTDAEMASFQVYAQDIDAAIAALKAQEESTE